MADLIAPDTKVTMTSASQVFAIRDNRPNGKLWRIRVSVDMLGLAKEKVCAAIDNKTKRSTLCHKKIVITAEASE